MNDLHRKLTTQKGILESQGYSVAYICIYGSQNYGLDISTDEYQSDIDMKAIVVPTLDDLVKDSKPISEVVETEWGQCDLKDIRVFFQTLLKANPAYVETMYTKYFIVDDKFIAEFNEIFKHRDELIHALRAQFIRAIYGMMCEKEKALCHPYPSIVHKIEKWGYDGKQAHHILRLWFMMQDYFCGNPLDSCFYPPKIMIPLLMELKLNKFSLKIVQEFVNDIMMDAKTFKDDVLSKIDESTIDFSIKDKFLQLSQDIIKNKIVEEVKSNASIILS